MSRISAPSGGGGLSLFPTGGAVSLQLASYETVTVPSGEVWMVSGGGSNIQFGTDNTDIIYSGTSIQRMIFPGGTAIKSQQNPSVLQGWDVSGAVDGTPHFEVNPSVPAGETWVGTIAYRITNPLEINSVNTGAKMNNPDFNHAVATVPGTLTGGDTVNQGIFGGWKI